MGTFRAWRASSFWLRSRGGECGGSRICPPPLKPSFSAISACAVSHLSESAVRKFSHFIVSRACESCGIRVKVLNRHMRFASRVSLLAVFALLLQLVTGVVPRVAYAAPMATVESAVSIEGFDQVVDASHISAPHGVTSAQDCINGNCGGLTCQCSCHGIVGAVPLLNLDLAPMEHIVGPPQFVAEFTSLTPIPPARPPKI